MGEVVQLLVQGLSLGSIYSCIAVGFTLIFASSSVAQFGAGNVVVFGAVMFAALNPVLGGAPSLLVVAAAGAVLGAVLYFGVIRLGESRRVSAIGLSIAALAAGLVLDVIIGIWTGDLPQVADPIVAGAFTVVGARIPWYSIYVIGAVALILAIVYLVVFRTMLGKAMQAIAFKPRVAEVSGLRVKQIVAVAWIISTVLMMVAGALLIPSSAVTRGLAMSLSVAGFAAAILGGLGSFKGAIAGGFLVAMAQTTFARYGDSAYTEVFVFLLLFVLIVLRPNGIFGVGLVRRA